MLTVRQVEQLQILVGPSAWGFYNGPRFPAEGRFDLSEITVSTEAELFSLASAILADACAVGKALGKGDGGGKLTIGPLTIADDYGADPELTALAGLWCNASSRLAKQAAGGSAGGVRPLPAIYAAGRQGARLGAVFIAPKLSGLSQALEDGSELRGPSDRAGPPL